MKRITLTAYCAILLSITMAAQARNGFNNSTLNDRYGFHVLALSLNLPDVTAGKSVPFAVSGYYRFNGDGTLIGKDTVSSQGQIIHRSYTGTYRVNANGSGTLTLNISPSFQPVGNFTIVDNGKALEVIFAVRGNLNTFELKEQSPN